MQNSSMTEQELLTDLLHTERAAIKEYASNCTESACMKLRDLLIDCMTECSEDQFAVFEQMKQRNLYKTKPAEQQEITTAKQEMNTLWLQTR
ncbi:MAG: spore coat protein [Clostridia bacterium]|nr:spore coat protein [Clostridia bacterium]MBQ2192272.1 spore coat protein [Clostridia bacterium]MBQ3938229.1 spore coat protein [Clostridia bacterium]MBQ5487481.1 spore coat protein [Clostridia bacterium]MBR4636608.1 spore coat protein [Clostridia bacterium]